ncbi:rho-related BTB domain-containing protein 1-like isoform X1 [Hydractinia symbiolongicarpus]|uniref:rho-related BTB domain-containing protein 1-like isoform X1 n=1 Tax=Hydractinia symbiolongicarpus TaxID=13093 RepID=UPI00254C7F7B|nr:rho-related BTB domain-containing protein 1-like isoform X1 [Hydractinia symbiolongicarpus]
MSRASNLTRGSLDAHEPVKCVVVGDTSVGKTRLICSYVYEEEGKSISSLCTRRHVPTVFAIDQYTSNNSIRSRVCVQGLQAQLRIWDTFGDHRKNLKFAYQNAHVVVVCFSIGMASSLRSVNAKWYPEIKKYCPRAPIILVGTQLDRRHTDRTAFKNFQFTTLTDILNHGIKRPVARYANADDRKCIPPEAGRQTSREINAIAYLETSIVTKYGIDDVFENAIQAAFSSWRLSRPLFCSHQKIVKKSLIQKPFLPDIPETPTIHISNDNSRLDFSPLLEDDSFSDITFMVEHELIHAHCIVLLVGCPVFYLLLTHPKILNVLGYDLSIQTNSKSICVTTGKINGSVVEGVPTGFETIHLLADAQGKCKIFVKVASVLASHFKCILEFIYTGQISGNHNPMHLIQTTIYLQMDLVSKYISNTLNQDSAANSELLNQVFIKRHLNVYQHLFKRSLYADVAFLVDNTIVPAHKQILVSACPVMAGMFRNDCFKESMTKNVDFQNTNLESFLAMLEYLYTGECHHYGDLHGTLQLANFLCLPRLVALCEKEIVNYITEMHENEDREVYSAVLATYKIAQLHKAPQLSAWCLHFMSTNYNQLCKEEQKQVKQLDESTLKHLEEHRWPPVWYLKEQDYYERTIMELEREENEKKKRHRKYTTCF